MDEIANQVEMINGPGLQRAATVSGIKDPETRRVTLSFSSEDALIYRSGSWWDDVGPWLERLGHNDDECDLSRANGGAMVALVDHRYYDIDAQVGIVEKAWIENGRGYADVRLSKREDVTPLWNDIVDGIVRNVSVGYSISERILVKENKTGGNEYRVTRWMPTELSFIPIPADATVGVGRSQDSSKQEPQKFTITNVKESRTMNDDKATTPVIPPVLPPPQDNTRALEDATKAERKRASDLTDLCTRHGMTPEFARKAIDDGITREECGLRILDAQRSAEASNNGDRSQVPPGSDLTGGPAAERTLDAGAIFAARRKSVDTHRNATR